MRSHAAADAGCLYGLNAQHDPWWAFALARHARSHDNGLLGALASVDLIFKFGNLLLALPSISTGTMSVSIGTVIATLSFSTVNHLTMISTRRACSKR